MAAPVDIPTPVANGSLEDAQKFVNTLPGNMSAEQRQTIAQDNQGHLPGFIPDSPPQPPASPQAPQGFVPDQPPTEEPPKSFNDPRVGKLGYYVNGDGNTVIAPKEGEGYLDTVKRAIVHSQTMSPEEREASLNRETSNLGAKVAGTMGDATAMGFGGAALLALTADTPEALKEIATRAPAAYQTARTFIYHSLAKATPELFGEAAAKETLKRMAVTAATKAIGFGVGGAGAAIGYKIWEEMFGKK